jgi:hypothetical protein
MAALDPATGICPLGNVARTCWSKDVAAACSGEHVTPVGVVGCAPPGLLSEENLGSSQYVFSAAAAITSNFCRSLEEEAVARI